MNQTNVMNNQNEQQPQMIVVEKQSGNGLGTAGFVLALIGLLLCWVPVVNAILWLLGFIFSMIGVFRPRKGLAIAGLVLSGVAAIVMFGIFGVLLNV